MKKYRCTQQKEDIIRIISEEFERVNNDLSKEHTPENYGRYRAFIDLLQKVTIYVDEE